MLKSLSQLKPLIFLFCITIFVLLTTGCNAQTDIDNETSAKDKITDEETFGSDDIGYITSNMRFTFKDIIYSFIVYESNDNNAMVSFSDVSGMYSKAINTYKEDIVKSDEDIDLDSLKETVYTKLIEGYKDSGYQIYTEDYTNKNNVEGTLMEGKRPESHQSQEYLGMLDEIDNNIDDTVSMLFITKECKIVLVYSSEDICEELINNYSYNI